MEAGGTTAVCAQSLQQRSPACPGTNRHPGKLEAGRRVGAINEHQDLFLLSVPCWKLSDAHQGTSIAESAWTPHHRDQTVWSLWTTVTPQLLWCSDYREHNPTGVTVRDCPDRVSGSWNGWYRASKGTWISFLQYRVNVRQRQISVRSG